MDYHRILVEEDHTTLGPNPVGNLLRHISPYACIFFAIALILDDSNHRSSCDELVIIQGSPSSIPFRFDPSRSQGFEPSNVPLSHGGTLLYPRGK